MIKMKIIGGNFNKNFSNDTKKIIERSVAELAIIGKNAAQNDMIMQKKAYPTFPSPLFNSFKIPKISKGGEITARVTAGDPDTADYAVFVDQPRQSFPGYFFMDEGLDAADKEAVNIFNKYLSRVKV